MHPWFVFWLFTLILKVQKTSLSLKSWLGALDDTGGSWLRFGILILIWILSLVFNTPVIKMFALYLHLKVQRTSISIKCWFEALQDAGCSWLGFGVLILIPMWSLVFDTQIFQILALFLIFKVQKHLCPLSPHLGLWRTLEVPDWGWHHYLDLDMVTGLWYINDPNFGSLSWFWRCKEHPCPLSPLSGFLRMLEVPDWGMTSLSWFGYGHWSLIHLWSKFWLSVLI